MEAIAAGIIAIVAIALAAFGIGRAKGKAKGEQIAERANQDVQTARREAAGERVKSSAAQDRRRIEDEIESLPTTSDGDELSAVERLRRDWSRD